MSADGAVLEVFHREIEVRCGDGGSPAATRMAWRFGCGERWWQVGGGVADEICARSDRVERRGERRMSVQRARDARTDATRPIRDKAGANVRISLGPSKRTVRLLSGGLV